MDRRPRRRHISEPADRGFTRQVEPELMVERPTFSAPMSIVAVDICMLRSSNFDRILHDHGSPHTYMRIIPRRRFACLLWMVSYHPLIRMNGARLSSP